MRQEIIDCDVVIQAGHENTPDGMTGGEGPLGKEIDWTPVVANEAVQMLQEAGIDAVKETARIKVTKQYYRCKLAIFVHFDAPDTGESGPSVGYDHDSDADAADEWKTLYKEYFPYNDTWLRDNATQNEQYYYGFRYTITSDSEFVVELGDLTSLRQARWLKPRLKWLGQLLAYFVSHRIGTGGLEKPDPFVSPVSADQGRTSMERPARDGGNLGTVWTAPYAGEPQVQNSGKGSWYSQYRGNYIWVDSGDKPGSNALGVPDSAQGCAFYNHSTLGDWFVVTAPNRKALLMPQTDIGPNPSTGRKIDISSHMAEAFGYTPRNFPTDSIFTWISAAPPAGLEGLTAKQQAIQWAKAPPPRPDPGPQVPPEIPPLQPNNNLLLVLLLMLLSKDKLMMDGPAKMLLPLLLQPALRGTQLDVNDLVSLLLTGKPGTGEAQWPLDNTPLLLELLNRLTTGKPGSGAAQAPTDINALLRQLLSQQLGLMPAAPPVKPAEPPVLSKPSVQLSAAGLGLSTILQALNIIPLPFGMGQTPSDYGTYGTLATLVPIITGVIGATGGFGALGGIASGLLNALRRPTP
jgi:hypothetical protein